MSACSFCCLFHCLVPCAVFLRCVDFWSCFVIGVIGLFFHVDCFFFLLNFSSFFALCSYFNSFLIDLLLFCAVCYFEEFLFFWCLLLSCCIWLEVVVVCCVTDASLPYTHTRPENFPVQEVRALQLHLGRLFGHILSHISFLRLDLFDRPPPHPPPSATFPPFGAHSSKQLAANVAHKEVPTSSKTASSLPDV